MAHPIHGMFRALRGRLGYWGCHSFLQDYTIWQQAHGDDNADKGWTSKSQMIIFMCCGVKYCDHNFLTQTLVPVLVNKYKVIYTFIDK